MSLAENNQNFQEQVIALLHSARKSVARTVNDVMVRTYFEIGRLIVEHKQYGSDRAGYGQELLKELSTTLTQSFGRGFSVDNLENMRRFYTAYQKSETLSRISQSETKSQFSATDTPPLSWSHYLKLMRIDDEDERRFYEIEAQRNGWSVRELKRQYDTSLYTRLALSRNKKETRKLSEEGLIIKQPQDLIKDPYVLEFLGIPEKNVYSESDLEEELIDKLEAFLLELGNGFTYVARQKRITFDEKHFRIDLVFYNRLLKCFVLIDLKIGELKHQDLGQMQMYVNYYDREMRLDDENKTIGLVLCRDKSQSVVEYTLPENNSQIYASKYQTVLPSREELKLLLEIKEEE